MNERDATQPLGDVINSQRLTSLGNQMVVSRIQVGLTVTFKSHFVCELYLTR
jgi:hypothetical protein